MRKAVILLSCLSCLCRAEEAQARGQAEVASLPSKWQAVAALLATSGPSEAFQAPGTVGTHSSAARGGSTKMKGPDTLEQQAKGLNPIIGYFDPLNLANKDFWRQGEDATVGFLRHSEIKHGRVAMAAFVGYILQSNGVHFPWKLSGKLSFEDIANAGSPPEQWDALPIPSKLQIIAFIGFLEGWSENKWVLEQDGDAHYMRGGTPGRFPSFDQVPHWTPGNLYDPGNFNRGAKADANKERRLLAEVNNGRLAMLGIMAFLAEQKIPGAVPFLSGLVKPYAGEVMNPLSQDAAFNWIRFGEILKKYPPMNR